MSRLDKPPLLNNKRSPTVCNKQWRPPKAHGGDDNTDDRRREITHYHFRTVEQAPLGSNSNTTLKRMDSPGNLRPAKNTGARNCPTAEEELNEIRATLKEAYHNFIERNNTRKVFKPKTATEETKFYLLKLIASLSNMNTSVPDEERKTRRDDAISNTANEAVIIKERVTKLLDNIPDKPQDNVPENVGDMLDCIETALYIYQQKINRYEQERKSTEREIEELSKDVSDVSNVREVEDTDYDCGVGIQKQIRCIRSQMNITERKLFARYDHEQDMVQKELQSLQNDIDGKDRECKLEMSKETENKVLKIIRQIRKKLVSEKRHQTGRYEQESKCIEREIKELSKDVSDLSNVREVKDTDYDCGAGIQKQIRCIRSQMNDQKRELFARYDHEQDMVQKELQSLQNDIDGKGRECKLEISEETENKVLKRIQQIQKKFVSEKRHQTESQRKLENQCEDQTKTLEEIWNIVSDERLPKQERKQSNRNYVVESLSNENSILECLKRWKIDRTILVDVAGELVKDISTLVTKEPFSFTLRKNIDTPELAHRLTPAFKQVVIDINGIKKCLQENCECFEEKYVSVNRSTDMRDHQTNLMKEIKKQGKEIKDLKNEKDELLNRLSKFAGANLTDNNPSITDLSDPNRATKLAEQFSELYDNQWTDAFDVLDIDDERRCIEYLLNIIVESYEMCGEISAIQQNALTKALCHPLEKLTERQKETNKENHDRGFQLSKIQSRTLSDLLKQTADLSIKDVKAYIAAEHVNWVKNSDLDKFTMSCVDLCWYMHLQSPPVYIDVTPVTDNMFDTDKYKAYTKSGKKVDFLVWPSLLLHKDGALLCKGVAQGK